MLTLDQLKPGKHARLAQILGANAITQRLMALGLMPGVDVRVLRIAPLGDPIAIEINGYHLSLRRAEARAVGIADA